MLSYGFRKSGKFQKQSGDFVTTKQGDDKVMSSNTQSPQPTEGAIANYLQAALMFMGRSSKMEVKPKQ